MHNVLKKLDCQLQEVRIQNTTSNLDKFVQLRALTSKDRDLLSHFDKIDESQAKIGNTSLKHLLINNHDVAFNKGKLKGQIPLEHKIGLCRTFKKMTKQLRFHLAFETADLQDIIYTTLGVDIKVIFDKNFFIRHNIHS